MTHYLIRVEGELTPDLTAAFPQLRTELELVQTLLHGEVSDTAELTGIINYLTALGVEIVDVVRIPK